MKRFFYALLAMMLIGVSSCVKDLTMTPEEVAELNYEEAFSEVFGTPSPTNDWGFASCTLPVSTMRAAYPNGNMWEEEGYGWPADITDAEREKVLAVFNQKGEEKYESLIDLDCFFVQQVFKGTAHYTNGDGQDVLGSDHMDWLYTITNKKEVVTCWWPKETEIQEVTPYEDHIFDFNDANSDDYGGRMLMVNSNTNIFGYHESESNGLYTHFRMEEIDGNYYVGFDYSAEGENPNQQVQRDFIYNDWIVKIVPGRGTTPKVYKTRIICEDLTVASGTDFDFNDAVFDVEYVEGADKMTITVKAAGGTIPLYIDGKEIHQLFKDANPDAHVIVPGGTLLGSMINTQANGGIDGLNEPVFQISKMNPVDIPITVTKSGVNVPLKSETGHPTAKIAVTPDFIWCTERTDIQTQYPKFSEYVKNEDAVWF